MSNRVTLEQMTRMQIGEVAGLPIEQLAMLVDDTDAMIATAKKYKDWLHGALKLRYGDRAEALRKSEGKQGGSVRIDEVDGYVAICDLPKKAEYDQAQLRQAVQTIVSWGSNPQDFITQEIKVSEAKYNAWPPEIRALFEPARTVRFGRPSFRIEKTKDG